MVQLQRTWLSWQKMRYRNKLFIIIIIIITSRMRTAISLDSSPTTCAGKADHGLVYVCPLL